MGSRGYQSGRLGAGRLAPVGEACAGGPVAAEAVHSAIPAYSAAAQGTGVGRNTGISGRTPARHDT
eukprot:5754771-Pleurochrysis_carterae.AAC.1